MVKPGVAQKVCFCELYIVANDACNIFRVMLNIKDETEDTEDEQPEKY